jgi:hypothetical protein
MKDATISGALKICDFPVKFPVLREIDPSENAADSSHLRNISMTFEAGGKQYVAIMTGLSRVSKTRHVAIPELREMRFQTMLFVFGL